jgi:hypothetical protein
VIVFFRIPFSTRFSFQVDFIGIMDQAVQNGVGQGAVGNKVMPGNIGNLSGIKSLSDSESSHPGPRGKGHPFAVGLITPHKAIWQRIQSGKSVSQLSSRRTPNKKIGS